MPIPRDIARFNRRFTNRLTSKLAGYLPGFAIVNHIGRKSGRAYRTPVNAFRTNGGYIIALTYGSESDWVENVLAAGSCELQTRGRRVRLINPHIVTDESKGWAPLPVRLILNRIDAPQYMRLSSAGHRSSITARGQRQEPRDSASPKRSPLRFILLVFALSSPFWLIQQRDWPITASVGAPLLAALILVYREEGGGGVRRLLRRIFDQRRIRDRIWYGPIIFLMPLIYLLTYGVVRLVGLPLPSDPFIPFLMILLLFALFFVLAVGEEVGWMGYAVDPMQDRWSALRTSIVLGLVTAIWHFVPLIQMGRSPTWIAWWSLSAVSIRILTVWLYNNTRRSLFAAIVFHAMTNLSVAMFPNYGSHWNPAVGGAITAIAAFIVTFLWGSRTLARYRYG